MSKQAKSNLVLWVGVAVFVAFLGYLSMNQPRYAYAETDTYDTNTDATVMVGGLPVCITYSGTHADGTTDLVVTAPTGFVAKRVMHVEGSAAPTQHVWINGMATDLKTFNGGTAANATTSTGIAVASGSVTIKAAVTNAAGDSYYGEACR